MYLEFADWPQGNETGARGDAKQTVESGERTDKHSHRNKNIALLLVYKAYI